MTKEAAIAKAKELFPYHSIVQLEDIDDVMIFGIIAPDPEMTPSKAVLAVNKNNDKIGISTFDLEAAVNKAKGA